MLSYNLFPAFQGTGKSYLIGASAGVMAVLIGIATHVPNMRVRLMLIGSVKFWYIAAFLVALDVILYTCDHSIRPVLRSYGLLFIWRIYSTFCSRWRGAVRIPDDVLLEEESV